MKSLKYALVGLSLFATQAIAEDTPEDKLVCSTKEDITKQLKGRGFSSLISFVNENGTKQLIWVTPDEAIITAEKTGEDVTCLVARMQKPVFNLKTLEAIYKSVAETPPNKE
jgi:hypothetical protein